MPKGHGPRVVKPRTAKQQAAAKLFSAVTFGRGPLGAAPASSWWIGLSREQLAERARTEQARMAMSKFGRLQGSPNQGE